MGLTDKIDPAMNTQKKSSLIGRLYKPNFREGIQPIGQSYNIFVRLIAMILAMNGLFPKDHPSLRGDDKFPYTIGDIITEAWSRLSFTKEGVPKVILFFAILGALACAVISLISGLFVVLMGHAHAQAYFTPPNTNSDIGFNIVDYLFGASNGGANSTSAYNNLNTAYNGQTGGTLPNLGLQNALWPALGFYSNALLIFGGIILFYHLMSMIVDTAHSGKVMGNANQIWAPIRLAAAVMLLVPVNGLNAGQMVVMQMAQWGSGLASNVWAVFQSNIPGSNGQSAIPSTPDVTDTVTNIVKMAACEINYNYDIYEGQLINPAALYNPDLYVNDWTNNWPGDPFDFNQSPGLPGAGAGPNSQSMVEVLSDRIIYHFQPGTPQLGQQDMCGSYTILNPPTNTDPTQLAIATAMYNANMTAFFDNLPAMLAYATNIQELIDDDGNINLNSNIPVDTLDGGMTLANLISAYQSELNNLVNTTGSIALANTNPYAALGWIGAGTYFNNISTVQSVGSTAAINYLPATKTPIFPLGGFSDYLEASLKHQAPATYAPIVASGGGGCGTPTANQDVTALFAMMEKFTGNIWDTLFDLTNFAAAQTGVWCMNGSIGVHFTGSNPLAQMSQWGMNNINLAMYDLNFASWLMVLGANASDIVGRIEDAIVSALAGLTSWWGHKTAKATGSKQAQTISDNMAGNAIAALIATAFGGGAVYLGYFLLGFFSMFMTIGVLFGVLLPLIPFLQFFFATISWIAILFEAVIAMPLVAIAHINPYGQGLPGDYARPAYFMAFSILLRPTLMIVGLIAGFMCLMLATSIFNIFFQNFLTTTVPSSHTVLMKIIYTCFYCAALISVANHSFNLISHIPNHVMAWINGQSVSGSQMGDMQHIQTYGVLAAGAMANRVGSSARPAARLASAGLQATIGGIGRSDAAGSITANQASQLGGISSGGSGGVAASTTETQAAAQIAAQRLSPQSQNF